MRICAGVFPYAFFLRLTKNKIRTRYAYFSGIYKEILLRCDVTRFLSVVVMILAFETFNWGWIPPKVKLLFLHKRNRLFFAIIFGIFFFDIFTKFLKLGLKYLINGRFSL